MCTTLEHNRIIKVGQTSKIKCNLYEAKLRYYNWEGCSEYLVGTPSTALVTCNKEINSYLTDAEQGCVDDSSNPGSVLWEAKRVCLLQLGKNEGGGKKGRRWLCCPYNRQQKGKAYGLETSTGNLGGQCWPENKCALIGSSVISKKLARNEH